MIILNRTEIEALIDLKTIAPAIEAAYIATSAGQVVLPPVGHITFPQIDADCHIKYGHLKGSDTFAIKVATGFPMNGAHDLPTGNGLVLVLSATTGTVLAILHDEMRLTDVRTGVGGAIATRLLSRPDATRVLVLGTGAQAQCQIEAHRAVLDRDLSFEVWGRDPAKAATLARQTGAAPCDHLETSVRQADIIITTTGSRAPLFPSDWVCAGTHITAVGADAPGKQELDPALVARADICLVDSLSQTIDHGEVSHAVREGLRDPQALNEIGHALVDPSLTRQSHSQITIADLTGIAAQDIAIADAVLTARKAQ